MRKYFGGLVAVLAIAALVPGTALATHSNGQGPDKDFRVGTHKGFCPTPFGSFPCQVHVNGQGFSATGTGVPARGTGTSGSTPVVSWVCPTRWRSPVRLSASRRSATTRGAG